MAPPQWRGLVARRSRRMKSVAAALTVVLAVAAGWESGAAAGGGECTPLERRVERDSSLPRPVRRTEAAILRAAYSCDYDELARIADFDFTATDLAPLIALFEGPVVLDGPIYVWPGTEPGARTAISDDGTWQFYETGAFRILAATDDGRI